MKNQTKRQKCFILIIFLILFFIVNYSYINNKLNEFFSNSDEVHIDRVIDGDTVVSEEQKIRLLGINTPERDEQYYEQAKKFLEDKILNKSVKLVYGRNKKDRYGRTLAYVFLNGKNMNKELVEEGLANIYFPSGKDIYYKDFLDAWKKCITLNKNLCKKSQEICARCIKLKNLDYKNEEIYLKNTCNFECDLTNWTIKDEGRKKFKFGNFILNPNKEILIKTGKQNNVSGIIFWGKYDSVWTDTGDTLFLRDNENDLVLWYSY